MAYKILIVDDDDAFRSALKRMLQRGGYQVSQASNHRSATEAVDTTDFDAILLDINLGDESGLDLCSAIGPRSGAPILMMTAFGSLDTAVRAMRLGAHDFLTKPIDREQLYVRVERACEHRALVRDVERLQIGAQKTAAESAIVGDSPAIKVLIERAGRVADTDASVLIRGETGTGKEVLAHYIHAMSPRRDGPFVPINCGAIPESLVESMLFGHVRGAFSGAIRDQTGKLAEAHGGTLFLDEIGELPPAMQVRLLRWLEDGLVTPVGGDRSTQTDVRVLSATHRDLQGLIAAGDFREDLYYRLRVVELTSPPLRERGRDILLLASAFLRRASARYARPLTGISHAAARRLLGYAWPGNVRELKNAIEHACIFARRNKLDVDDFSEVLPQSGAVEPAPLTLAAVERAHILSVLDTNEGNRSRTAEQLGIGRKTLYRKLRDYGRE